MASELVRISKFLSLVLRHKPDTIGLNLDENGWASVDELIRLSSEHGHPFDRVLLEQVVRDNDKQRFVISPDGLLIRANQGHSVEIDLKLAPIKPPELLYHGTADRFLPSIRMTGLNSGKRQHVHLSPDEPTAIKVGQRHGKPVVLRVKAIGMQELGFQFYLSANGVWLTKDVPVIHLVFPPPLDQPALPGVH
jgi:putative RNA 2'-phosphotransferase